jgi:hypothetical protein
MYTSSTCFKTWTYVLEWEHTEHCEVSILEHWNLSKGLHTNHIDKFYIYWHSCKKLPTIIRVTHNNSLEPQLNISLCQISSWKLLWATSFISLRNRCEWTLLFYARCWLEVSRKIHVLSTPTKLLQWPTPIECIMIMHPQYLDYLELWSEKTGS